METAHWIRTNILTTEFMFVLWSIVLFSSLALAIKTKISEFCIISGGSLSLVVYYLYTSFGFWPTVDYGHIYSRVAQIIFVLSLLVFFVRIKRKILSWSFKIFTP